MSKEITIRYLKDSGGDSYFPMTHKNAVIGLDDLIERIETLETENIDLVEKNNQLENRIIKIESRKDG